MVIREPRWLGRADIDFIHFGQLREHGGGYGVRDENLLESAIARPRVKWGYEPDADLLALAASLGFGLANNHPYVDGNKRTAFVAMAVFLLVNGQRLRAPEPEAVITMLALASSRLTELELVAWIRSKSEPA
jgi:death-on-curing protein